MKKTQETISTGIVDVYFSPNGEATNAIITELNNAKTEILVQACSFPVSQLQRPYQIPINEEFILRLYSIKARNQENIPQRILLLMLEYPYISTLNLQSTFNY